jgi:hypothetical protein
VIALVSVAFAAGCWWVVTKNRGRNAPKIDQADETQRPAFLQKR